MSEDRQYREAEQAIDRLYSDTRVPIEGTIDRLERLRDDIDSRLAALREDLARANE